MRKCPYCDFNSHALPSGKDPSHAYVDALIADLKTSDQLAQNRPLISIFIGGGTPSLIQPGELERFLDAVQTNFSVDPNIEITLEANPGTVDTEHFQAYRSSPIKPLSMGRQSFNEELLKRLGRIHNRKEAHRAIKIAQETFDNFNLDGMFALPGQTLSELEIELQEAIRSQTTHLSFYQISLEPNTIFAKHVPEDIPDPDTIEQMQKVLSSTL